MGDFEKVKKTVQEIEILKDALEELGRTDETDVMRNLVPIALQNVELGSNTYTLLNESAAKFIDDAKKLIDYEIGERMKKLNIVEI
jgi:hypothetical protein